MNDGKLSSAALKVTTLPIVKNNVTNDTTFVQNMFVAGATQLCHDQWLYVTSDKFILQAVAGTMLEFVDELPPLRQPRRLQFTDFESDVIDKQIIAFLQLGIVEKTEHSSDEFISNIFIRDKKDGSHRLILNLVELNPFIAYHHFKMDTIESVINMMRPNCFMASIDLAKAYYSIPVVTAHRRFLRFEWNDVLYQFRVIPNGLSSGPRTFTKILKPVYAYLRQRGHIVSGYIDDSFIMSDSLDSCVDSVACTARLFTSLGFCINVSKSVTRPTQELEHLGFVLNSVDMTVSLPTRKVDNLIRKCKHVLNAVRLTIRELAELIGILVSSFTAVEFGRLHYRHLEAVKVQALKASAGNFDATVVISPEAKKEVFWWINQVKTEVRHIDHGKFTICLTTDASTLGWGAVLDPVIISEEQQTTGGRWTLEEKREHINVLELKAGLLGLQSFCSDSSNAHVKIYLDNCTGVSYINHLGGSHSPRCNEIAQSIWEFCRQRYLWITASHLPGHLNVVADHHSRVFDDKTEWKLNPLVFQRIVQQFIKPDIDLFASRLNFQLKPFVSWRPDPLAKCIDAFTFDWAHEVFYAFPPFSILPQVLKKIEYDGAKGILIVPNWTTQVWFPLLSRLLLAEPLHLEWRDDLLTLPFQEGLHPLGHKLRLMACFLCGNRSLRKDCRKPRLQ